ncbi:hypothetical protein WJX72_004950 [[Myrmecia] bisecta]|uniref:Nucleotide exchange factor Fes1 domain-containing protein n=1 Tax=[Myrmecia] bisecta TaxID=41462 RepID=A0AAW1QEY4_9CHLO
MTSPRAVLAVLCLSVSGLCFHIQASTGQGLAITPNATALSQAWEAADLFQTQQASPEGGQHELQDLLHWAIEHSDPAELKRRAEEAQQTSDPNKLAEMQQRVQELSELLRSQKSETELLQEAITLLNTTEVDAEKLQALEDMQVLVEPIDNANDLKVLGGLPPLVRHLHSGSPEVQAAVCHVLGTAASNNIKFQEQLLADFPDAVRLLVQVAGSPRDATATKAVYATAAMLRNSEDARRLFYRAGGPELLHRLLVPPNASTGLRRKVLNLIADLAQLDSRQSIGTAPLASAVQQLLRHDDWDMREKALLTIQALISSNAENANMFQQQQLQAALQWLQADLNRQQADGSLEPGYHEDLSALLSDVQGQLQSR